MCKLGDHSTRAVPRTTFVKHGKKQERGGLSEACQRASQENPLTIQHGSTANGASGYVVPACGVGTCGAGFAQNCVLTRSQQNLALMCQAHHTFGGVTDIPAGNPRYKSAFVVRARRVHIALTSSSATETWTWQSSLRWVPVLCQLQSGTRLEYQTHRDCRDVLTWQPRPATEKPQ